MKQGDGTPQISVEDEKPVCMQYVEVHEPNGAIKENSRDFCRLYQDEKEEAGACQMQGGRRYQEDFFSISSSAVQSFQSITVDARIFAYTQIFKTLQEKYGNQPKIGSTAISVTAWRNEDFSQLTLTIANLGDSMAIMVVLTPDNKLEACFLLNALHRPDNPDEMKRITEEGGAVEKNRLHDAYSISGASLGLSRGLGDTRMPAYSHLPQVEEHVFETQKIGRVFVMLASDGLESLSCQQIGDIISANHAKTLPEMAHLLVNAAYTLPAKPSGDNATALLFEPGIKPISAALFDGHGGDYVARHSAHAFYPSFKKLIQSIKTPEAFKFVIKQVEREWRRQERERADEELSLNAMREKFLNVMTIENEMQAHVFYQQDRAAHFTLFFATNKGTELLADVKKIARSYEFHILSVSFSKQNHAALSYRYHFLLTNENQLKNMSLFKINQFKSAVKRYIETGVIEAQPVRFGESLFFQRIRLPVTTSNSSEASSQVSRSRVMPYPSTLISSVSEHNPLLNPSTTINHPSPLEITDSEPDDNDPQAGCLTAVWRALCNP